MEAIAFLLAELRMLDHLLDQWVVYLAMSSYCQTDDVTHPGYEVLRHLFQVIPVRLQLWINALKRF